MHVAPTTSEDSRIKVVYEGLLNRRPNESLELVVDRIVGEVVIAIGERSERDDEGVLQEESRFSSIATVLTRQRRLRACVGQLDALTYVEPFTVTFRRVVGSSGEGKDVRSFVVAQRGSGGCRSKTSVLEREERGSKQGSFGRGCSGFVLEGYDVSDDAHGLRSRCRGGGKQWSVGGQARLPPLNAETSSEAETLALSLLLTNHSSTTFGVQH